MLEIELCKIVFLRNFSEGLQEATSLTHLRFGPFWRKVPEMLFV